MKWFRVFQQHFWKQFYQSSYPTIRPSIVWLNIWAAFEQRYHTNLLISLVNWIKAWPLTAIMGSLSSCIAFPNSDSDVLWHFSAVELQDEMWDTSGFDVSFASLYGSTASVAAEVSHVTPELLTSLDDRVSVFDCGNLYFAAFSVVLEFSLFSHTRPCVAIATCKFSASSLISCGRSSIRDRLFSTSFNPCRDVTSSLSSYTSNKYNYNQTYWSHGNKPCVKATLCFLLVCFFLKPKSLIIVHVMSIFMCVWDERMRWGGPCIFVATSLKVY